MAASSAPTPPLQVLPFRATTFDPRVVSSLAAVSSPPGGQPLGPLTSPPYDVVGRADAARWRGLDPHNVVRLTLPTLSADGTPDYAGARTTLEAWRAEGVLHTDTEDALYAYEIEIGPLRTLGIVAAVSLHDAGQRRILPHEDVFPDPVTDRAALMRATRAQLEPILLTYDGRGDDPAGDDASARAVLRRVVQEPPWRAVETEDGAIHRLWRIGSPADHAAVAADLSDRQALIADGHHRYRAYLIERGVLPGSDLGLAYVVDDGLHPLRLHGIHRSVRGLGLGSALARLRDVPGVEVIRYRGSIAAFVDQPPTAGSGNDATTRPPGDDATQPGGDDAARFVVSDGRRHHEVRVPWKVADAADEVSRAPGPHLDAVVLQQVVFAQAWRVDDADPRVDFHHDVDAALGAAAGGPGEAVAVLVRAPRVADVVAVAAEGRLMPRKSTSFGPKPRTGLLMRMLED